MDALPGSQPLPLGRPAQRQVALIGELRVGNRDCSEEAVSDARRLGIGDGRQSGRNQPIDHCVDAAHEEAGHAAHVRGVTAVLDERGEAVHVRSRDRFVALDAEEQGDVDVDALAGQFTNRGRPSMDAGTLIITLSRATAFQRRRASSIVAAVSCARYGDTSRLTYPSARAVLS